MLWFAVAFGGAVGALIRWGVSLIAMPLSGFPAGTLLCNISGSYALGLLQRKAAAGGWPAWAVHGIGSGMIGAFTTMSAFGMETWQLLNEQHWFTAIVYAAISGTLGPLAACYGIGKPAENREGRAQ
jgi:CrcB protein